jgi:hypothetical protein
MLDDASVLTTLNYAVKDGVMPEFYLYKPEPGTVMNSPKVDPQQVSVSNARGREGDFALDKEGFQYVTHETNVDDFWRNRNVRGAYYDEVVDLLMRETGAAEVLAFDYNIRNKEVSEQTPLAQNPIMSVHNDYTEVSGPQRVSDLIDQSEVDQWLGGRYVFINVWKPISRPVEESPLGVCAATSMIQDDFIATALRYRDRTGQVYSVAHNPDHEWFYLEDMQPNEVLLLKCFDSAEDGRARYTAHSAFEDPNSLPDARPRESIEVRTIARFD